MWWGAPPRPAWPTDGARARFHDLLGKTRWDSVIGNGESEAFWARHKADLDDRKSFRDLRFRWFDGDRERIYSISGRPVSSQDGTFLGYRGSARDVASPRLGAARAHPILFLSFVLSPSRVFVLSQTTNTFAGAGDDPGGGARRCCSSCQQRTRER